jgi:two-component system CheB/CheR fusion protein
MPIDPPEEKQSALFIVGLGASAGGLEALSVVLSHTEFDGAAFVVVQHLAPLQKSMLTELLGRASRLEVVTAEHGERVGANRVYVAPPNAILAIKEGVLQLTEPVKGSRQHLPIDAFFRSLADDQGRQAIGVILSGTGTDGTFGSMAIRAAGGITFAQEPSTAKFDGMPRSSIDSGAADFVLPPEGIAAEIYRLTKSGPSSRLSSSSRLAAVGEFEQAVGDLGVLIKKEFGLDLSHYKPNTIERRIQRRMTLCRVDEIERYLALCRSDPRELATLHNDLLINVTSFFRDEESFEVLKGTVIPRIFERKGEAEPIRIWVPGCSSGEEAYSIAICLLEALEEKKRSAKIQIFGTDLDSEAIQQARRGFYAPNIASDVSVERLRKYFVKLDDGRYQISRQVRDLVVFSVQNLCVDAPFSRLDLVSCRNLLIYLQPGIQKKILRVLRYSLLPESFLMLGTSESIGESADLFSLLDRKNKIYVAKHVALPPAMLDLSLGSTRVPSHEVVQTSSVRPMITIAHLADRRILEQYAPPGVVINENLHVLYFRGKASNYLEQPSGVATHDVLRLVRPELYAPLKAAIERAFRINDVVTEEAQIRDPLLGFRPISLVVQPLIEPETRAKCLLILFKEAGRAEVPPAMLQPLPSDERTRVLEQELTLTKDYLHSTIEELERSNEDLKSANEELQSSNEELQSTNEELETAKEELQSTNEELITLNEELQRRMLDLGSANDDLQNLLVAEDRAVVVVGLDLRIRLFTQAAEKLLNMMAGDEGRTLAQVARFFAPDAGVEQQVSRAIDTLVTSEQPILGQDGRKFRLRVLPYKTSDLAIRGALLVLLELS